MTPLIVLAVLAAAVAVWVTAVHPRLNFCGFALVLALVPYLHVPGTEIPVLVVLTVGIWVALAFLPGLDLRPGWPEGGLLLLAAVAGLSLVATGVSPGSLREYAAWLAVTSVAVPVRFLPDPDRRAFVTTFVVGCAVSGLLGIVLLVVDPQGLLLGQLSFAGYDPAAANAQYVLGTEDNNLRLTGTFVEPNIAGLVLAVGLLLGVACFRGRQRLLLAGVIGAALALTLSRSALATIVVAVLLLVLFARGRQRTALLGASAAAALGALVVPTVRERVLTSFGAYDTGSRARGLALADFPDQVAGHWWWGLGWDREEYRDPVVGRTVNFVANTPLLTVYRGGLLVAGLGVLLLLALVVRSLLVARRSFEQAVLSCGVVSFCLVALQLDFPVVIQHPAAAVFSVLVGLSLGRPR